MTLWPFKRTPRQVPLTDEALDRAIRSGVQFPLEWFLLQPPEVQETIAARRDMWLEDVAVMVGYAVMDPERTRLSLAAADGDEQADEALEEMDAVAIAEEIGRRVAQRGSGEPSRPILHTMSGVGERRQAAEESREAGQRKGSLSSFGGEEVKSA